MTSSKFIQELESYAIITLALVVSSIGWVGFIIPSNIVGGGLMGLSSLVFFATDLPVGPTNLVLNAVLIAVAIKILGKGFGIKTIYSVVILSIMVSVLPYYITEPIVKEKFMAAIIGGGLSGASIGILFSQRASTGGTEVIAMLVNHYRNISPGKVMMFCDILIIGSSYIIFGSIETVVYGYVVMGVMSYVADMLLTGSRQSVQIMVMSDKSDEVAQKISSEINRGLTIISGRGYYSKTPREYLMMISRKSESHHILHIIKEVDPDAFISVGNVMAVYGNGFDQYRPPIRSKAIRRS